ncbi:MAG TPA: hypothetical protein VNK05_12750 [Chloroflexota bacterium]|nr:hypothetical protein [Chloroflexota bacterium]
MDTMTSRYPDADLQASLRHLRRFLRVGAVALVLTGLSLSFATDPAGAAGGKTGDVVITGIAAAETSADPALTRKVNEYEGQHRLAAVERGEGLDTGLLTRKVNEYEGQHR